MLGSRNASQTCGACRLNLFTIFRHGFTQSTVRNIARYSTRISSRRQLPKSCQILTLRTLSTNQPRFEYVTQGASTTEAQTADDIEAVVRQARKTFGETLPKNYLSAAEYQLYERLYGPPLRETIAEDVFEAEAFDEKEQPRNVMLKDSENGSVEEIEYDPSLGFEVTSDILGDSAGADEAAIEGSVVDEDMDQLNHAESQEKLPEEIIDLEAGLEEVLEHREAESDSGDLPVSKKTGYAFDNQARARNQREYEVLKRLQNDLENSLASRPPPREHGEDKSIVGDQDQLKEDEEENEAEDIHPDIYAGTESPRLHPHTLAARSVTRPSTLNLPVESFITPITEALDRTNIKHLRTAAEKMLGGKHLPYSPSTPLPCKLLAQKPIGLDPSQGRMSEIEADAYITAVMPPIYATAMSTLTEVRRRLGKDWLRGLLQRSGNEGARVLDAGGGGAGIGAWREIINAEWDVMKDEGLVTQDSPPIGKATVVTGPDTLRHRVSRFLENTTFLPRLPDYLHTSDSQDLMDGTSSQQRKVFDVIIAPHTLWPLQEDYRRKNMVQNLWKMLEPKGGVLILIEKGLPRGFEAIAGARSLILDRHISSPGATRVETETQSSLESSEKDLGMIIAPCTNHGGCPMYPVAGMSHGRKDFCYFVQRYHRPHFLQRALGASASNHEDIQYSYLAVRKGIDVRQGRNPMVQGEVATRQALAGYEDIDLPEERVGVDSASRSDPGEPGADTKYNPLTLPRVVLPPLKRHGHVILDLCTPSGTLERWTVTKSFSKVAYHDARKARWGDLWALGAKTRVPRNPRLGRKLNQGMEDGATRKQKQETRSQRRGAMEKKVREEASNSEGSLGMGRNADKQNAWEDQPRRPKRSKNRMDVEREEEETLYN